MGIEKLRTALLVGLATAVFTSAGIHPRAQAPARGDPSAWRVEAGPRLPEPVANNAVTGATIDGRALVFSFLGIGAARDYRAIVRSAYQLDVRRGLWERLPDVPGRAGRLAATAQSLNGRVYVFGGYEVAADAKETTASATDIYDIASRAYTRGADIPIPVDDSVSGVWRDRLIYLVGGWSMSANVAVVQIYDPARDEWQQATPMIGTAVFGHAGGIVRDAIVYCGGAKMNAPGTPKYLPSSDCYRGDISPSSPATIAWRRIASMPGPQRYRIAAGPVEAGGVSGVIFMGGTSNPYNYNAVGYDGKPSEPEPSSWIYDVVNDRWLAGPRSAVATMDHRGVAHAGDAWYVVGGFAKGQDVTAHVSRITDGAIK